MSNIPPQYPMYQPVPPPKKQANPWMILGWVIVGMLVVCGGGCGAVIGLTALGSTVSTTTTTQPGPAATTPPSTTTTTP